jgi:DNA-binding NarL/FixJ family response regulator
MAQLRVDAADPRPRHPGAPDLNPRDLTVLDHLAEGTSTAGIASALSISGNTARTRIRRVQRKLDVSDRAAAVRAARDLGVLLGPVSRYCH